MLSAASPDLALLPAAAPTRAALSASLSTRFVVPGGDVHGAARVSVAFPFNLAATGFIIECV